MVWPGGLDAQYADAVSRPYRQWARIDVYSRSDVLLRTDLPFASAILDANLLRRINRNLTFTLADADPSHPWFPRNSLGGIDAAGTLSPYGNRVRAYCGIEYGDGTRDEFPVFTGRIDKTRVNRAGQVTVLCSDLAADIVDAKFETPTNSTATNNVITEWQRLVRGGLADADFGTSDDIAAAYPIGALSWESDRGQALDDMAAGVGCLWWTLADGSFVLRRQPWSARGLAPAFVLGDGTSTGRRIISEYEVEISRDNVANSVVFSSERLDGSPPLTAIARDLDPSSPTYWLGNFGKKPILIQNQAPTSVAQVQYAARVQLQYAKTLTQTWSNVQIIPDPSLELGDVITCAAGGLKSDQAVIGYSFGLRENQAMQLTLRAYSPLLSV